MVHEQRSARRSRWAAIGAAVAVSLGGGGAFVAGAAASSPSSVVTIDPVRVLDTRDSVDVGLPGPFRSPVSQKLRLTGSVPTTSGNAVVVPAGATGVLLNVTAVGPTADGFISIRPGDATGAPKTSSLNFSANETAPNSVQVALPTTGTNAGQIDVTFDALGVAGPTTDILIDVVGYLVEGAGAVGPAGPAGAVGPAGADGADGADGAVGPAGPSSIVQVTDLDGAWTARAADVAGIRMTGDGIESGPFPDAGLCDPGDAGVGYARLDYSGMNGKQLSSLTSLVLHARYMADTNTFGIGAPSVRVDFEDGGTTSRLTFSANTQFNNPLSYDIEPGEMHEWVITSGTVRLNDDPGENPLGELPWDSFMADYGDRNITNISVLSGCGDGDNLVTLIRRAEVNGTTFVFGAN